MNPFRAARRANFLDPERRSSSLPTATSVPARNQWAGIARTCNFGAVVAVKIGAQNNFGIWLVIAPAVRPQARPEDTEAVLPE